MARSNTDVGVRCRESELTLPYYSHVYFCTAHTYEKPSLNVPHPRGCVSRPFKSQPPSTSQGSHSRECGIEHRPQTCVGDFPKGSFPRAAPWNRKYRSQRNINLERIFAGNIRNIPFAVEASYTEWGRYSGQISLVTNMWGP